MEPAASLYHPNALATIRDAREIAQAEIMRTLEEMRKTAIAAVAANPPPRGPTEELKRIRIALASFDRDGDGQMTALDLVRRAVRHAEAAAAGERAARGSLRQRDDQLGIALRDANAVRLELAGIVPTLGHEAAAEIARAVRAHVEALAAERDALRLELDALRGRHQ